MLPDIGKCPHGTKLLLAEKHWYGLYQSMNMGEGRKWKDNRPQIRTLKDTIRDQEEKENPIKETDKEWSEK